MNGWFIFIINWADFARITGFIKALEDIIAIIRIIQDSIRSVSFINNSITIVITSDSITIIVNSIIITNSKVYFIIKIILINLFD